MSGKFSKFGRLIGGLDAVGLLAVGVFTLFNTQEGVGNAIGLSIYTICVSFIVFLIELPFMCNCISLCKRLSHSRAHMFIAGFWISRAIVFALVAAGGIAIYVKTVNDQSWVLLTMHIALALSAASYFMAVVTREPGPDGKEAQEAQAAVQAKAGAAASSFGGFFARGAAKAASDNPQMMGAMAAAAAPTLAQQMFGGGGGFGASAAPVGGAGDAEALPGTAAAFHTGGFGGSAVGSGGGGGIESFKPSGGGLKGFYDEEEGGSGAGGGAASREALFSGGSLFGGAGSGAGTASHAGSASPTGPAPDTHAVAASKAAKYGVAAGSLGAPLAGGDDIPEDNPFAS